MRYMFRKPRNGELSASARFGGAVKEWSMACMYGNCVELFT